MYSGEANLWTPAYVVLFVVLPITGAVPPILVGPIVYLAAWRDSWQLIGEVKTRLLIGHAQSTVGSVAMMASRIAVSV